MYDKPALWQREERIQWGCVLMQLLGETSLQQLHMVLAGFRSVTHSQQAASYTRAIQTARVLLSDLLTQNAVQSAIYDFMEQAQHRSFTINPATKHFTPIYANGLDPNITTAARTLQQGLSRQINSQRYADTTSDLLVQLDTDHRIPLRMHGIPFPPITQHPRPRHTRSTIMVRWSDLRALAEQMDQEDVQAQRLPRWVTILDRMRLQATTGHGLQETDVLDLQGLKHLIGLPGSGKTTLITLLCVLLARRGQRVAVFFTSIGVARAYLETLQRYQVQVAILMGRSGRTHRHHANTMAELIAGQGEGGFGRTRAGIDLFATSCPLPAFAESWPEAWSPGDAPCESLYEVGSKEPKLCPAWERCGRVKNQRDLVTAHVWLGHVISADTPMPAHTSPERMRYFEYIAEAFDLVIFDECDEAQKVLDDYGTLTLELTGDEDSLHPSLQRLTSLLATNRARVSDRGIRYILQANEFERHVVRLVAEIRRLFQQVDTQTLAHAYSDQLLTSNFLIREALRAARTHQQFDSRALSALSDFWERAMYEAFFRRGNAQAQWSKARTYADDLGLTIDDARAVWQRVTEDLKQYLALDHAAEAAEVITTITDALVPLFRADSADQIRHHVRLLIVVGFTVASYQRLAKTAGPLVQRGEIPADLVFFRSSSELRELVPRSLLGTFSAVRYRRTPDGHGYNIDYLVLDTTPRMLFSRMYEQGTVNVLLTSATSWLPASTAYHIAPRPTYVLGAPTADSGRVQLYLLPKKHPSTQQPLRFSGGGTERDDHLRHMVTALAQPEVGHLSELERTLRSMTTPLGRQRKAALIVNSYEQVRLVVEQIGAVNTTLAPRTRGVLHERVRAAGPAQYVLKGQVEELGYAADVDLLVFPMAALGRGINLVFHTQDDDHGAAAVGAIYFLTRPHPAAGDLHLMTSLLAQATQHFDEEHFHHHALTEIQGIYAKRRYQIYRRVANLLARPMSASQLDRETLQNFAANLLVPIMQTIGRGMRKGMPVDVYFVDAAWAPNSAQDQPETDRSSILLVMREILEACVSTPDPDLRDVATALYGSFHSAFRNIIGLLPPVPGSLTSGELFNPSPLTPEVDFDLDEYADHADTRLDPLEDDSEEEYYEDEEVV